MTDREIIESPFFQGEDETIARTLTTTPWGSSPTSPTVKLYSYNTSTYAYTDVSSSCLTGSASVDGDVITLPAIHGLTAGTRYRMEVQFTISGNVFEAWAWVDGEK